MSSETLDRLRVGFDGHAYSFPMFDAGGDAVGVQLRPYRNVASKQNKIGSAVGLFLPIDVTADRVEIVAEGLSDLATALDLGFGAIGRADAGSRADWVSGFLRPAANPCPCVMGDNDEAGRRGAEALADELVAEGIPCRVLFPPAPWKDLREWRAEADLTGRALAKAIRSAKLRFPEGGGKGFVMTGNAAIRRGLIGRIGLNAFGVLMVIASHQDRDGIAQVSRAQIRKATGLSRGAVDMAKTKLHRVGLVAWTKGTQHNPNVYRLNHPPIRGARIQPAVNPILDCD